MAVNIEKKRLTESSLNRMSIGSNALVPANVGEERLRFTSVSSLLGPGMESGSNPNRDAPSSDPTGKEYRNHFGTLEVFSIPKLGSRFN